MGSLADTDTPPCDDHHHHHHHRKHPLDVRAAVRCVDLLLHRALPPLLLVPRPLRGRGLLRLCFREAAARLPRLPSDSSPRIFPAWSFRDDTGLGVHSPDSAQAPDDATDAKKGKIRRIAGGDDAADAGDMTMNMGMSNGSCGRQPPSMMNSEKLEKKPWEKWTMGRTQMLVARCNKVRGLIAISMLLLLLWAIMQWGVRN